MYCELKCNLFLVLQNLEDTLQRLHFLLLPTYLNISRTGTT